MAIRWRLRRMICVFTTIISGFVVYWIVTPSVVRSTAWIQHQNKASVTPPRLTFINRPLDLSSADGRKSRLEQVQSACASHPEGSTMNILVYERKPSMRMSYCVVPKAGRTFWIRIFRFLNNDTGGMPARTPFDIERVLVHDTARRSMKMYRMQSQADRLVLENSTRFLFSRDPFSRVWSAYVDKLLLPNMWSSTGRDIVSRRPNASARSLACGNDVTFREFVEYIVHQSETKSSRNLNGHWRPIQYVCDPCQFKPHFVGKQETFITDTRAILNHFDLDNLLHGYDSNVHLREEVSDITSYNFALLQSIPAACATSKLLAQRLWAAFQLNGYLPFSSNVSVLEGLASEQLTGDTFKRLVYGEQERHWQEIQLSGFIHRKSVVNGFSPLPAALLQRFVDVYRMDFEYFGYDKRPKDIFG